MSKLIFEDNNGIKHDLALKNVPVKNLKPTDIIMIDCEVGKNTEENAVRIYLNDVKNMMQIYFPKQKVIVTAMREGKKDIKIKIINDKK